MKRFYNLYLTFCSVILLMTAGCTDILNEQPRANLAPDYFRTADGLRQGLTAAYSGMRFYYGTAGGMSITVLGADEFTAGGMANSDMIAINGYTEQLNAGNGQFQTPWNRFFTFINTCNGVIQYGQDATGIADSEKAALIAQAKYLRGAYYFLLVRMFGGVPLDLGSGELQFNTTPVTTSQRNSVSEVYTAIVQDLTDAVDTLPNDDEPGRADKAAALHLLSKVYLTRGWHEEAAQPDDFQQAYDKATELINNQGDYGLALEQDFADVNRPGNEHGSEVIWTVERTTDLFFSESNDFATDNGLKENRSSYFFHPYYEIQTVTVTDGGEEVEVSPVTRTLEYQRPWIRFKPTDWLLQTAFANKTEDSRWDKTFRNVWLCNTETGAPYFAIGDTAFYMPGHPVSDAFEASKTYRIWEPDEYTHNMYPDLKKYDDLDRANVQFASTRPFIVYKLSETYLIAAEAAFKLGQEPDAVPLLNTIRRRAAYRAGKTAAENAAAATALEITVGDVDLDFILAERSRELSGEQMRWFDLVRTQTLVERVRAYNDGGASDVNPGANIQPHHVLRPIPNSQIDRMTGADAAAYQNPGYAD